MIDFIKKYYLNILLVVFYTAIAMTVYIIWFDSMWHLWYIDLITGIVIFAIGCVLGFFYVKSEVKKRNASADAKDKPEEKIEEKVEETKETGDETIGE